VRRLLLLDGWGEPPVEPHGVRQVQQRQVPADADADAQAHAGAAHAATHAAAHATTDAAHAAADAGLRIRGHWGTLPQLCRVCPRMVSH
jgi:hypothetical protein